ncbi:hypothetical protein BDA96_08G085300 [Sorghum bicolor]|uniref:Uncharacterized protein n=2 Tax=Sorghum bicolor TaxID=4558 RepID=A0A1Z5R5H3_SORBI|nr:hypothetical protein BDA96_08G085300 [Sorghum bicolor]OQU78967.1 hypothetical protein SORBI_3008G079650 [Sorghum bicolor]OQU78968.1 hypothetical protein SORBI_3008G079650 [Sorghum bicolor]
MPTPSFQPFNPFAVLNPNPQNLNAFGWDEWPNVMPANEAQFLPEADPVPQLIEPEPPLLPVEPVQIVEFPNFENLQPLVPEEVDYNDLLGYVNPPVNEGNGNLHIEENLHVGFAQFYQPAAKNMWMNPLVFKPSPEALRQWSPSFDWAKHFLQSPAWDYFSKAAPDIPESTVQAQAKRMPRKGKKPILSEADVRRSLRIKKLHKGFKLQTYKDKNCLGCSSTPPEISPSLIRNLDASFCDINPEDLSDVNLHAKPSPSQPVNKKSKQVKKKDSKAPKKDGDK